MSQIGIRSQFVPFDLKICDLIDSREQKIFKKFDKNQFEISLIRLDSTSNPNTLRPPIDNFSKIKTLRDVLFSL